MTKNTSFLNLFRAAAALWVVLAHCGIWGWGGVTDIIEPKKAVDLFMVISGFLMIYTIDKAAGRENPFFWKTWRNSTYGVTSGLLRRSMWHLERFSSYKGSWSTVTEA